MILSKTGSFSLLPSSRPTPVRFQYPAQPGLADDIIQPDFVARRWRRLTSRRQEISGRMRTIKVVPRLEFSVDHIEMPLSSTLALIGDDDFQKCLKNK